MITTELAKKNNRYFIRTFLTASSFFFFFLVAILMGQITKKHSQHPHQNSDFGLVNELLSLVRTICSSIEYIYIYAYI
jgi:hypothetical protein